MGIESILACNLQILQWLSESSEFDDGDSKRHREALLLLPSTRSVCRGSGFNQVELPDIWTHNFDIVRRIFGLTCPLGLRHRQESLK